LFTWTNDLHLGEVIYVYAIWLPRNNLTAGRGATGEVLRIALGVVH